MPRRDVTADRQCLSASAQDSAVHASEGRRIAMGKYAFAWLLGVPLALLTLIYVLAHL